MQDLSRYFNNYFSYGGLFSITQYINGRWKTTTESHAFLRFRIFFRFQHPGKFLIIFHERKFILLFQLGINFWWLDSTGNILPKMHIPDLSIVQITLNLFISSVANISSTVLYTVCFL